MDSQNAFQMRGEETLASSQGSPVWPNIKLQSVVAIKEIRFRAPSGALHHRTSVLGKDNSVLLRCVNRHIYMK